MAIVLNNSANISYQYGDMTDGALSNIATTSLVENVNLNALKTSNNTSWRPQENLTFNIRVSNDGLEPLYDVSIQDDLGSGTPRLLTYVTDSARMLRNDVISTITPTNTSPLTMVIPDTLAPGEVVILTYVAKVRADVDPELTEITNEVTVVGHETSVAGPTITVDPSPSLTLPKASYAEVRMTKSVDKENVMDGDTLTYTFLLENSGNAEATNIVITDDLPLNFTVNAISSTTDGVVTTFDTTDYSIGENNRLVLPTSVTKTISVPASTSAGNGRTTVTIEGTVNS